MNPFPTQANKDRRAFTLIELLTVIAIIAVLAAILIPVVGNVRRSSYQTTSASNLRQIAAAAGMWSNDNGGHMLPNQSKESGAFTISLAPYIGFEGVEDGNYNKYFNDRAKAELPPEGVYDNPAVDYVTKSGHYADYGINIWVSGWESDDPDNEGKALYKTWRATQIEDPSRVYWFAETVDCQKNVRGNWGNLAKPHPGETVNIAFLDGHVELVSYEEATAVTDRKKYPWGWPGIPN